MRTPTNDHSSNAAHQHGLLRRAVLSPCEERRAVSLHTCMTPAVGVLDSG